MEHESFEDAATAALMNAHFVNIKVDREERPDLDQIYMPPCRRMTGSGGWPLTVFLTPDGGPSSAAPTSRPTTARAAGLPRCSSGGRGWRARRDESAAQAAS